MGIKKLLSSIVDVACANTFCNLSSELNSATDENRKYLQYQMKNLYDMINSPEEMNEDQIIS